jgi:hypothetical protein
MSIPVVNINIKYDDEKGVHPVVVYTYTFKVVSRKDPNILVDVRGTGKRLDARHSRH